MHIHISEIKLVIVSLYTNTWDRLVLYSITLPDGTKQDTCGEIDFNYARKYTLDTANSDVLILLDCCHAGAVAIGGGKKFIAACAIDTKTQDPIRNSLSSCLLRELNHARGLGEYLTGAQLWSMSHYTPSPPALPSP